MEETIQRDNDGTVDVKVSVNPALQKNDKIVLYLDGKIAAETTVATTAIATELRFTLHGVERGEHQLQARVVKIEQRANNINAPNINVPNASGFLRNNINKLEEGHINTEIDQNQNNADNANIDNDTNNTAKTSPTLIDNSSTTITFFVQQPHLITY